MDYRGTADQNSLDVGQYSNGFSKKFHTTTSSFHTAAGKAVGQWQKKEPVCTYCKGSHTANQCTVIQGHQQRVSIVKLAGLCYNCLVHHKVLQCTSHRCCKHCSQKHHTSLCPPLLPPTFRDANPPPATNAVHKLQTVHSHHLPPAVHKCQHMLQWLDQHQFIVPAAIATVQQAQSVLKEIFSSMKERSTPSSHKTLLTDFCLKATHTERISLSSFGHPVSAARSLQVATITVHTQDYTVVPISVLLIVPQLAAPLQNSVRVNIRTVPYLKELKLAHPVTEEDSYEINILVGADYYWTFIQDHLCPRTG